MSTAARLFAAVAVAALLLPTTALAQEADGPTITTHVVESFDGEPIVTHLFLPEGASDAAPVPLVLRTHGWGGTGETGIGGTLERLLDEGYAVLTWDQRGFGCSGGVVHIDRPGIEGQDVSALIDWAVANAPLATEGGDPVVGFTGGSYAGGIQLATAAIDDRIDALAPEIAWQDLRYSLYSGEVLNQGWASLLYAAGAATASGQGLSPDCPGFAEHGPQEGGLHEMIHQGFAEGTATGTVSDEVLDFFALSSLAHYGQQDPVAVPTLVMQGSVDTLFDLTDGWRIREHVRAQGAPSRFVAFCGGHVACPDSYEDADDRAHLNDAIVAWFARHLKGDTAMDTGPAVEYRTNDGQWRSAEAFPPPTFGAVTASGEGSLVSIPAADPPSPEELAGQVEALDDGGIPGLPITTAQPASELELSNGQAFTVEVAAAEDGPLELLGIPEVSLDVDGTGNEVVLFAKLVHREANEVVNLQEGAIRVPLGGGDAEAAASTTVDVPMSGVAYSLPEGDHLDLQVSTASLMHGNARTPAQVDVAVEASVPADVPPAATSAEDSSSRSSGSGARAGATTTLPATGGGAGALVPLLLAVGIGARGAWRRR